MKILGCGWLVWIGYDWELMRYDIRHQYRTE
jgi:hypothetical protein